MKHLEIKSYFHKGIEVIVELNYDKETISLVERTNVCDYVPKRYLFAERTVDFMEGWIVILQAKEYAIREAKKEMEKFLEDRFKMVEKEIIDLTIFNRKENE